MPSPLIAYSLATVPDKIAELCGLGHTAKYEKKYQARPGQKLPIITLNDGVPEISEAWWGIRGNLSSAFLDMSRVLKTRPYNVLIRRQRCAVPANCFITWNNKNVHLVRLLQHRLFLMGGIWQEYKGERYFTLLETESADILSHAVPCP